jgi:ribose 5-phosphate isomerase
VLRPSGPRACALTRGAGSTVPYVVERIVAQGPEANASRVFIPTGAALPSSRAHVADPPRAAAGFQSKELIVRGGLRLGDIDQHTALDVTLDGADECDGALNAVKGGGACHLREKVLAEAARTFVVVADFRKNSAVLGTNVRAPRAPRPARADRARSTPAACPSRPRRSRTRACSRACAPWARRAPRSAWPSARPARS